MNPEPNNLENAEVTKEKHPVFRVTKTSKYLATLLFIIMPFVGGWIGYTYAPEKVVEVEKVVRIENNKAEVLTPYEWYEYISADMYENTATATFKGYYKQIDRYGMDETTIFPCHVLQLTGRPQNIFHEYYIQHILYGNGMQFFSYSNLNLNIPWEEIPEEDKTFIEQSVNKSDVKIILQHKPPTGGDVASPCASYFEYKGLDKGE